MTLAALGAAVLAACGGGGGGGAPSEQAAAAAKAPQSPTVAVHAGEAAERSNRYIVQMADAPVSAYRGGVAGYKATRPSAGGKIDPLATDVVRYGAYLVAQHDGALSAVGAAGRKSYSYQYVFNGFAAQLTELEAAKLAARPGVLAVVPDARRQLDTSSTPTFLGLDAPGGLWTKAKGEGVIIGIVDGGIWPEHPSFSDRTDTNGNATKDGKLGYQQIPGWNGKCQPGERFTGTDCNQKLIGARYYNAGYGGNDGVREQLPYEYLSPRDYDGHGTHTASTAGGNAGVAATGPAAVFGKVSGMAPRARIAAYKVCWGVGGTANAGCFNSDSVAAIDQAVADGVDVINFSISGTQTNFLDPVEVAFLFAADAGVFVATSAGNSGPTVSTVAHPSPWITTVAAGTHNRDGRGSVTLGNGATYNGASIAQPVGPAPLISASAAALPGANAALVALCYGATDGTTVLDPAKVAGKIVVCDRGVTARVNKSLAVKQAGGVGMILTNVTANSINADLHAVPTVHLQNTDRAAILAYAATNGATATINASTVVDDAAAPFTATFSSRGPSLAAGGDLLKPDIIAPGQDILAAVSPSGHGGNLFDLLSGTSMSSPHIAGIAALFKEAKPTWSPMAIKSALMTSAGDILDGLNTDPTVIFRQGAGHVKPNAAFETGLVLDHGFNEWLAFLCGTTNGVNPASCTALRNAGFSTEPSNLNVASIAIGDMAGKQTVTRKLTNVGAADESYTVSVSGLAGVTVTPTPATLKVGRGQTATLNLEFLRTSAALNTYTGGQLLLTSSSGKVVRLPIVIRPVALAAPASVSGNGGAIDYSVTFGYDGAFSATARGLVAAAITSNTISDDPTNGSCALTTPPAAGFQHIAVNIPAGTTHARFALFDADVASGADIDLCVFRGTTLVGSSASGTSAEEVNLVSPAAGDYTVVVQGWGVAGTSPYKLHTWLLGSTSAGNMAVAAPAAASTGGVGTISLTFSGLAAGTRYLGSVAYDGVAGLPNPTIVRVDMP